MKSPKKLRGVLFLLVIVCLAMHEGVSFADDRDDVFNILDAWTCVRWGEDNIAWIVHYPEELVEPWVRSEAARYNMRPEQTDEIRKSFSDELRIGSATAILLSVYGYGAAQTNLAPMAKNIVLIDSAGKRIAPIVFEKKLDNPISGLMQGFVFFPLQQDKNFRISVRGLVPDRETNFTFQGTSKPRGEIETAPASPPVPARAKTLPDEEVVVKIPTRKNAPNKPSKPEITPPELPEFENDGEVFAPTEPAVLPAPEPEPEPEPEPMPEIAAAVSQEPEKPVEVTTVPDTPKGTLGNYLKAWAEGDTDTMYSLLSSESRGHISKELFAKEVMSGSFRNALRSGYKVNWTGNAAKVTVVKRVLFVRTLETKQLDFVAENGSWRVAW
ncbi:MAG: hypothetical protein LBU13_04805 [Synergistaceae bacterium]|jgi:hypothetical protein|nr:hypothetical protein [Synergistaceae bacterium]